MNIYIIHGYMANVSAHWFEWLRKQLPTHKVSIIYLPNAQHPVLTDWISAIDHSIDILNEETIIISHSLGCYTTLKYLENKKFDQIRAFIAVAGFERSLTTIPELDNYLSTPIKFTNINYKVKNKIVIASESDKIVPFYYSQELAKSLNAELIEENNAGHFMATDGYSTFPNLLAIINAII